MIELTSADGRLLQGETELARIDFDAHMFPAAANIESSGPRDTAATSGSASRFSARVRHAPL
jgi:hypothetical protein